MRPPRNHAPDMPLSILARLSLLAVALLLAVLLAPGRSIHADLPVPDLEDGFTWRLTSVAGLEGLDPSVFEPDLTRYGQHVTFHSRATNLAPGASDGTDHIYFVNVLDGPESIELVSRNQFGAPANGNSVDPVINKDLDHTGRVGRYIAYASDATNLVLGDTNGIPDIYVWDRIEKRTVRVSVDSEGNQGYYEGEHTTVCHADVTISDDGRYVGFVSMARLVPADTNDFADIYLHDRDYDEDGIFDEQDEFGGIRTWIVSRNERGEALNGNCGRPTLSGDGEKMAWVSWATNVLPDSMPPDDNEEIDGFCTDVGELRRTGERNIALITQAMDGGWQNIGGCTPSVSYDGRFVSFTSHSTNLAPNTGPDTDPPPHQGAVPLKAFLRDMWNTGPDKIIHISQNHEGGPPDESCYRTVMSLDNGRVFVTFVSDASDIRPDDDADHVRDVYVARVECFDGWPRYKSTFLLSKVFPEGLKADAISDDPTITNVGNVAGTVFTSAATNWSEEEEASGFADLYFVGKRLR